MTTLIPEGMLSLLTEVIGPLKSDATDAFEHVLEKTYTRMAEDVRDERDTLIEAIDSKDRYRGREVVQIVDDAIKSILDVVERNLPSTTEKPGLSDTYFNLINS